MISNFPYLLYIHVIRVYSNPFVNDQREYKGSKISPNIHDESYLWFPDQNSIDIVHTHKRFFNIRIRGQILGIRCYFSFRFTYFTQTLRNELLWVCYKTNFTLFRHIYRTVCISSTRPDHAAILTVSGGVTTSLYGTC